jgi:hypothetical protein
MRVALKQFCKYILPFLTVCLGIACSRENPQGRDVHFVIESAPFTKGEEFSGVSLSEDNSRLLITSSMRGPDGEIVTPSVFTSAGSPTYAALKKNGGVWEVDGTPLVLPIGGYSLDVIAFGTDSDEGNDVSSFGTGDVWAPVISGANATSVVSFTVDTYSHQMDLMYGAVNVANSGTSYLSLEHALALLIFNIKFTGADMAFIETNDTDYKFKLDGIFFVNSDGLTQYLANPSTITAANVLLKTRGTFTIDYSKNNLEAGWTGLSAIAGNYSMPMYPAPASPSIANPSVQSTVFSNQEASWRIDGIERDKFYQLGHPLLVPQQPIQDVILVYTYDGARYSASVDLPTGYWFSGEKYIYNLVVSRVGPFSGHQWIYSL